MATYYIDYSAADDSANGLTKVTAWKRHPYMQGFGGAYVHSSGDQFIFKGGETWPNACFPVAVVAGGSGEVTRDYYGVDNTWYSGGSWTKPVWDLQDTEVASNNIVYNFLNGLSYITVDNIEITNFYWTGTSTYGDDIIFRHGNCTYITFSNLYIHDWTHGASSTGTGDNMYVFLGDTNSPWNTGCKVKNCEVTGHPSGEDSGCAIYGGMPTVASSVFHDMSNAIVNAVASGATIHDCIVYNINTSFDTTNHTNAMEPVGPIVMYNNKIYGLIKGVYIMLQPGANGGGFDKVYNNLFITSEATCPIPIQVDHYDTDSASSGCYFFNNTFSASSSMTDIKFQIRGVTNIPLAVIKNNHFITSQGDPPITGAANVDDYTYSDNLVQTLAVANAQGYTDVNEYAPTLGGDTIDEGTSESGYFTTDCLGVTRPKNGVWDIGAYEYEGEASGLIMWFRSS